LELILTIRIFWIRSLSVLSANWSFAILFNSIHVVTGYVSLVFKHKISKFHTVMNTHLLINISSKNDNQMCSMSSRNTNKSSNISLSLSLSLFDYSSIFSLQIMLDRGFQKDMESLPIICSHCDWTDILQNYQVISLHFIPFFHFLFFSQQETSWSSSSKSTMSLLWWTIHFYRSFQSTSSISLSKDNCWLFVKRLWLSSTSMHISLFIRIVLWMWCLDCSMRIIKSLSK
jgi:hypothetical protein